MTHPYLRAFLEAGEEAVVKVDGLQIGTPVFTGARLFHLASIRIGNELGTVADAEHRNLSHELAEVYLESLRVVDGIRRSGQDHADHRRVVLGKLVVRQNLAEGIQLSHTPPDELCRL